MGRVRCAPIPANGRDGELAGGHVDVRPGGHGEVLRGSRGDAAGTELGSSFVERVVSEHGNRSGPCPVPRFRRGCSGWVHRRLTGPGRGGAAVVPVSYTHLRAHETDSYLVCRLLLEKKK